MNSADLRRYIIQVTCKYNVRLIKWQEEKSVTGVTLTRESVSLLYYSLIFVYISFKFHDSSSASNDLLSRIECNNQDNNNNNNYKIKYSRALANTCIECFFLLSSRLDINGE